jgi:GMP synthase-like glutamine amidotransferase
VSTVCILQHAVSEPPGAIVDALRAARHALEIVRTFDGEPVPADPDGMDGLVAMGGPMGVYEEARHPFLRDEMRLIEKTLGAGKPVLGVRLGRQLLATVLGATVRRGKRREIGWYPVRLSEAGSGDILFSGVNSSFAAFHWHEDIFDLPHGSTGLAEWVLLSASLGRVLAEDVFADEDAVPYARSAMDGYAVRAIDTRGATSDHPVRLRVLGSTSPCH